MAEARSRLAFKEVRASVARMQSEGERLVSRLRRDARAIAQRSRKEGVDGLLAEARKIQTDLRKRAERAMKELESRRASIVSSVEEQVTKITETVIERLNVARHDEMVALRKRVHELEKRLDRMDSAKENAA